MEFVFAYLAGTLTLINPCVLPVLPIVLASALQASPKGPLALAAGLGASFVVVGVLVSSVGLAFGILAEDVARIGALIMVGFGVVLLSPALSSKFTLATAGFSDRADHGMDVIDRSTLRGQFLGGALLGAVWSPCVGPTLGGAIALAAQGQNLAKATLIMVFFAFGVATIVLLLAYGARATLLKRREFMRKLASKSRTIMGVMFILVGLALLLELHIVAERWAVQNLPAWFTDLSVSI
ncbi:MULTISPECIES: cytochrome c biogenesis CcdA family protein [Halocynthiibacter]|uniref:Cytochrome c biogenesis CcdA family protein n=1 Tax=Halocynthiibacter halioticoli TaxID=2986804 RepID=A0AAE3J0U5_9RHOB|nr:MULTISPECIES: cytochrome c biogenesis CcdA family protein [Halocynthiibacter]MCV6823142.1 cytochrome c biogenesis CcdA family protein [Halocynthiibacter halioticoli]MCW4056143.1 cytochrome c biogenesis CcdA family protein [Halocynthiibacter sp. SDUM655004]MDE0590881.1 cytochrome c biogenesis CcdA family protein [Halocynthiibacter sp. C4]